jgi:predicted nucleotidyltransferase
MTTVRVHRYTRRAHRILKRHAAPEGSVRALWDRYGWNEHRRRLLMRLDEVLDYMREHGQKFDQITVFGSFTSKKAEPEDIDVFWLTSKRPDGQRLLTLEGHEHAELSAVKRADVDLTTFPSVRLYEDAVKWAEQRGPVVRITSF